MASLFDLYKKPWRTKKRADGHWYIEDSNGHAIASICVSPMELKKQAAHELLHPNALFVAVDGMQYEIAIAVALLERGMYTEEAELLRDKFQNLRALVSH